MFVSVYTIAQNIITLMSASAVALTLHAGAGIPNTAVLLKGTNASSQITTKLTAGGDLSNSGTHLTQNLAVKTLPNCDTIDTTSTGAFKCGTDATGAASAPEVGTASLSGAVLRMGDPRYVNAAGDTMTGALIISVTGGNDATLGLRVLNTISGAILRATKQITSSGTLVTESGATFDGGTLYVDAAGNRVGVGTTTPKAVLDVAGTISGKTLVISSNGSFSGAVVVAKSISGAALEILGTASGQNLFATRSVSGTYLYAATTFGGAGLASCSNASTSKLLYNSATKQFSCGTDQTAAGGGISYIAAEGWFVNQGGDTMSGALTISVTGGNDATIGLKILNTTSGAIIHAEKKINLGVILPSAISPVSGDIWYESGKTLKSYTNGANMGFATILFTQTGASNLRNTSTTGSILGSGRGTKTIPANFFTPGKTIRLTQRGVYSTTGSPGVQVAFQIDGSTILGMASQLFGSVAGGNYWEISVSMTCVTTGASGQFNAVGQLNRAATATSGVPYQLVVPLGKTFTMDTTAAHRLDTTWHWLVASVLNTSTGSTAIIEVLN